MPASRPDCDVIVIGSGLAGSSLAAILARGGARTQILDAGTHPRFAIGESTIPYTSMLMRLVSERYDVPEIKKLASFENVQAAISPNCGVKRNFGFVYHREGEPQRYEECHEFPIPRITHLENHFFRQDVDAWMLNVAVDCGARVKQRTLVSDVEFDAGGATVTTDDGRSFHGRYVIDASGFRSPIVTKLGLREQPTRLRHHSRSLFTHMLGVRGYEDTVAPGAHGNPTKWSQGTLHHLFEGGWMWVIPFNNHPRATNPLVSVGLSLDPRIHPPFDGTPQEEFDDFLRRFPDIAKQFEGATAVRPWVRTPRLQYSSKQTTGYRWCLTSHAAGFVDALFSRGLTNTFEIVNALGWRVLDALAEDDFSEERFAPVQALEQSLIDFNDDLVANAYTSFGNFKLWDAWFRVWSLGQRLATFEINCAYARYLETHDSRELEHLAAIAPQGSIPEHRPTRELMDRVSERVRAVQDGDADAERAAAGILHDLAGADFVPPAFSLDDPENRWFQATPRKIIKTLRWARNDAPEPIGDLVHDGLKLFARTRVSGDEFHLGEELKHKLAAVPVVGRRLRVPTTAR